MILPTSTPSILEKKCIMWKYLTPFFKGCKLFFYQIEGQNKTWNCASKIDFINSFISLKLWIFGKRSFQPGFKRSTRRRGEKPRVKHEEAIETIWICSCVFYITRYLSNSEINSFWPFIFLFSDFMNFENLIF